MEIVLKGIRVTEPLRGESGRRWQRGEILAIREVGRLWHRQHWLSGNPQPVTITRVPGTATVTHNAHGKSNGDLVVIEGSNEARYNGPKRIRDVTANTYAYDLETGTPQATGEITSDTSDDPAATDYDSLVCHVPKKFFIIIPDYPDRALERVHRVWTEQHTVDGDEHNVDVANFVNNREWVIDIEAFPPPIRNKINNPPHSVERSWDQVRNNTSGRRRARTMIEDDTI